MQVELLMAQAADCGWPLYELIEEHLVDVGGIEPAHMACECPRSGPLTGAYRDYLASVMRFARAKLRHKRKRTAIYADQITERLNKIKLYKR